jgi:hypothetical protein
VLEEVIQGIPIEALRLGVYGRGDSTSTRSLLLRHGMMGPRPMEKAADWHLAAVADSCAAGWV